MRTYRSIFSSVIQIFIWAILLIPNFSYSQGTNTVFDKIAADPNFDDFEDAIIRAGLRSTFDQNGTYTIFAVPDGLFPNIPQSMSQEDIRDLVLTHCVQGFYREDNFTDGFSISSMNQRNLTVQVNGVGIFINANILDETDDFASNGVLHTIRGFIDVSETTETTVFSLIANSPFHRNLTNIIINGRLDDTLQQKQNLTFFAPTDDAFNNLNSSQRTRLYDDNLNYVQNVLYHHAVEAILERADFKDDTTFNALNNQVLTISVDLNGTFVKTAKIEFTGLPASNGIVYVIDKFLLPTSVPLTIADIIDQSPDHTILSNYITTSGLRVFLTEELPFKYTFFAPNNDAFNALPQSTLDQFAADPEIFLQGVLQHHMLNDKNYIDDLVEAETALSVNGFELRFEQNVGGYLVNDQGEAYNVDQEADNGLCHFIDKVLVTENPISFTINDFLNLDENLSNFNTYVQKGNLDGLLSQTNSSFTVFAPTNGAMTLLPAQLREELDGIDINPAQDFVNNHILLSEVSGSGLTDGLVLTARNGFQLVVRRENNQLFVNDSQVIFTDIETDNGVIHIIDLAIYPPQDPTTIYEYLDVTEEHSILKNAIDQTSLQGIFDSPGMLTLFAPTNNAFNALPGEFINEIFNDNGALLDLIFEHTLNMEFTAFQLGNLTQVTNSNLNNLTITVDNNQLFINDARIIRQDILLDNGVVHVLDAVLADPIVTNTIRDVVAGSSLHNSLDNLISQAQLDDYYRDETGLTLFAPTDDAFNILPSGFINALLADPTGALRELLLNHTVDAVTDASDLQALSTITMIGGQQNIVRVENGNIFINDALIVVEDVQADNGLVHIIDAVILPTVRNTVYDVIISDSRFTTLEAAINAAGIDVDLINESGITFFAPTDDAFDALPAGTVDALLADAMGALKNVLEYHKFNNELSSSAITDGLEIFMDNGEPSIFSFNNGNILINNATIIEADIQADNGLVHVIDMVSSNTPEITVYDIISAESSLLTFKSAVDLSGQDTYLQTTDEVTVFAPTNAAFNIVPVDVLNEILADPNGLLLELIQNHQFNSTLLASNINSDLLISLRGGLTGTIRFTPDGIFINNAEIVTADLIADNGVVHIIDAVIMEEEQEPTTVYDFIRDEEELTQFEDAVNQANLVDLMEGDADITVFAPTDEAFSTLGQWIIDDIFNGSANDLRDFVLDHVHLNLLNSSDLTDQRIVNMASGINVIILLENGETFIAEARINTNPFVADNGHVFLLDGFITPLSTSTEDLEQGELSLSPNPTSGLISINGAPADGELYRIVNAQGQQLQVGKTKRQSFDVDISEMPQGLYYLIINDNLGQAVPIIKLK